MHFIVYVSGIDNKIFHFQILGIQRNKNNLHTQVYKHKRMTRVSDARRVRKLV